MKKAIFQNQSPLVKFFFLLILSVAGISLFLFFGSALVRLLWGFNILESPEVLQDYNDPFVMDANRLLLLFQHLGFFIVPGLVFLVLSTPDPKGFVLWKTNKIRVFNVIAATVLVFSLMPLVNFLVGWNQSISLPDFMSGFEATIKTMEESAEKLTEALVKMDSISDFLYMVILVAVMPAIGEELMFRGIIQRLLAEQFRNYHWGIWGSAFLFSAIHMQFYGFFPRMFLGASFGYLLVWTGNIIYPMLAHFINNFASLLVAYLIQHGRIPTEFDTVGENQEWQYILPGMVFSILLVYYFWKNRDVNLLKSYAIIPEYPDFHNNSNE